MLNAMREGAKKGISKFILFGFMVMAVGGLVLMDVGGFFGRGVTRTAVAKIDGDELPIVTFDRTVRRVLSNQGLDAKTAYQLGFINQILQSEINQNLLQRYAHDLGLRVGDEVVLKQVNKLIEPFVSEAIDYKTAFNNILRAQGMTEREFVRMIRAQMSNSLLNNTIQIGANVPPEAEAKDLYQYRNEERAVDVIYFPHDKIRNVEEPDENILKAFYQAGMEHYAIPETRVFTVATLSQDKLKDTLEVSEDELRTIYERDIDTYTLAERRVVAQAVIDNQATATAIAGRIAEGKSLAEAVKAETGSDNAYLGEETFEQAGLLENVARPVFEAEVGEVVGPLESALGWHVLVVKKILEPDTRPFAEVRDELRKELLEMRVADQMFALAADIDDSLAGGMTLEEASETLGLELKKYGPIRADGSTPDSKDGVKEFGPDWSYITETVFGLTEGEVSPVIELADDRYAAVRVDEIIEKSFKPFGDVRTELGKTWLQDQREIENKLLVDAALRALNNGETDLKKLAAVHKTAIKTYKIVRMDQPPEPLENPAKQLFFFLDKDNYGAAPAKDGYVVGQVRAITLPDTAGLKPEQLDPVIQIAQRGNQEEFLQLFMLQLQDEYDVRINERLLEKTYGPGREF